MKDKIEIIKRIRTYLLDHVKELSIDQLNKIPPGFNNNIIWNMGHLIAAQQGICYMRAGLKAWIRDEFFNDYKPGSKPEKIIGEEEVAEIKGLFFSTLDVLEQDLEKSLWPSYPAWTTRYGVPITSIEEGINFLQFHEGLHSGYIMALKKSV